MAVRVEVRCGFDTHHCFWWFTRPINKTYCNLLSVRPQVLPEHPTYHTLLPTITCYAHGERGLMAGSSGRNASPFRGGGEEDSNLISVCLTLSKPLTFLNLVITDKRAGGIRTQSHDNGRPSNRGPNSRHSLPKCHERLTQAATTAKPSEECILLCQNNADRPCSFEAIHLRNPIPSAYLPTG